MEAAVVVTAAVLAAVAVTAATVAEDTAAEAAAAADIALAGDGAAAVGAVVPATGAIVGAVPAGAVPIAGADLGIIVLCLPAGVVAGSMAAGISPSADPGINRAHMATRPWPPRAFASCPLVPLESSPVVAKPTIARATPIIPSTTTNTRRWPNPPDWRRKAVRSYASRKRSPRPLSRRLLRVQAARPT